ncbi:MAG: YihY/virulence factor BrkB family protein [Nitrococcus sp.]|nr:YihY/virulence factor BrkB family protein [Nitrococcus sp.]
MVQEERPSEEKQAFEHRGRMAKRPWEISGSGWRDIALRVWNNVSDHNILILAAAVAFYAFLSIFPALVAIVSIYGLIANPADVQTQFSHYGGILPEEARTLISQQLQRITASASSTMSAGLVLGLLFALWTATQVTKAFITALNVVYAEKEKRGILQFNQVALLMTFGGIILAVLALALIVVLPIVLSTLDLPAALSALLSYLPWLLLAGCFILWLTVLFRYGPSRKEPQWNWVSLGSIATTVLWIIASILFSFYVSNFGQYNTTYGSIGAIIILLLWFYVTAFVVLLGAELNAGMEHQTTIDTTKGKARPMGKRGAYVADTIGASFEGKGMK